MTFPFCMRRLVVVAALGIPALFGGCATGQTRAAPPVVHVIDQRGPASVGPSILVGGDVDELNALLAGAGAECPAGCWPAPSDPTLAYLAVTATAPCADRDLAASVSGSALTVTVRWRALDCRGVAVSSELDYSLLSVQRKALPPGRIRVAMHYAGHTAYPGPLDAEAVLDAAPPPAPAIEQAGVAAAIGAARNDAGGVARDLRLSGLYRVHCSGGDDSYVVTLFRLAGGPNFNGQYANGIRPEASLGCPAP